MENKKLTVLTNEQIFEKLRTQPIPQRAGYLAMYSTWYGGIIRDPQLMMIPIDDHIVHRGDGVFEAAKCVDGKVFALRPHLERLAKSAARISLMLPHSIDEIQEICLETVRVSGARDAMLRLYISRGPGGFTANPYEPVASQMYLVITPYKPLPKEKYENGCRVAFSQIAIKEGFFSTVKSCNYLPNVLMKKESVDLGIDFTVARDAQGVIAESSTENFGIISESGELVIPSFDRTLRGITAIRVMELASALVRSGHLKGVRNGDLKIEDVARAREAMMLGTTLDCIPVVEFEGKPVADGKVGPVCRELLRLLLQDMSEGPLVHKLAPLNVDALP